MNKDYTEINIVLDESGSMAGLRKETIGGFNTFLEDQKKAPGICKITTTKFNTAFNILHNGADIRTIQPLTEATYSPGGGTALLDAIARTITATGQRLEAMSESDRPARVIVLIMTDGEENSSVEYGGEAGRSKVMEMIKHQTERYNWQFLFIGAQQDAIQTAARYGICASNALSSASTSKGTGRVYAAASANIRSYRAADPANVTALSFSPEQRDEQVLEGAALDALNSSKEKTDASTKSTKTVV